MSAPVPHHPVRTDLACRNCGTPASLKFCPECGQETVLHPPTLVEFLHEFVGHYVALEGALWQTLRLLLTRPGRLTREYLDGRRRRYVLPLRLYLTCSFLFFLAVKLTPSPSIDHPVVVDVTGKRLGTVAELQARADAAAKAASMVASGVVAAHRPRYEELRPVDCGASGQRSCNWFETLVNDSGAGFSEHPQEVVQHMQAHIVAWAPYLIFLMLPAFAGIMKLTYWNRRMTYGEHVVFSLHVHAFWFLLFLAIWLAPEGLAGLLELAVPVYGTWAMHETYGGRWLPTIARAAFASAIYALLLTVVAFASSVTLLAMG
ncbi:MAG: DUF3667 domain-containing protein [Vitreoscilla sp.]